MTIRPLATLKALRGIGGSYEQLCNERRISDLLEAMLEGMAEAMAESQSGTMTFDEIKAGHAVDCDVAGNCNYCGGPVYHRYGKPGEYDHECNPPAKTDMQIIAEQCAVIEARRGY